MVSLCHKESQRQDSEVWLEGSSTPSGLRYMETCTFPGSSGSTTQVGFQLHQQSLDPIISLMHVQPSDF